MTEKWKFRWGYWVKPTAAPGVLQLKGGGHLVHGKKPDGNRVMRSVETESLRDAQRARLEMLAESKTKPLSTPPSKQLFATYAVSLLKRKVAQGEIKSDATKERWTDTLELHLVPAFGRLPVDAIGKSELEQWKVEVSRTFIPPAERPRADGAGGPWTALRGSAEYSPTTANGWLSILFTILREAVAEFDFPRDPTLRVRTFSTEDRPTYTDENPNALPPDKVRQFLVTFRRQFPQHYAMALLGFLTGLRPSSLRPLRRSGPEADVDWELATLKVRRSNSRGQGVMRSTKQGTQYTIGLPLDVMRELRAHVKSLEGVRANEDCDLLFPSRGRGGGNTASPFDATPGMMSRSALDKPFDWVSSRMKLGFMLTPRGMRRTFQDLCRAAKVEDDLQKFICGHSGQIARKDEGSRMTRHYSTFRPDETREALAKIATLLLGSPSKAKRAAKRSEAAA